MKTLLISLFFLLSITAFGLSIGDWNHTTPGMNKMHDPGGSTFLQLSKTNTELPVRQWYFYKNHIIRYIPKKYFIVQEQTQIIQWFNTKTSWNIALEEQQLKPLVWTRWYKDNWVDGEVLLIAALFGFFISIPLLQLYIWICYEAIAGRSFQNKRIVRIIAASVPLSIGLMMLLDYYPQSF